MKGAETDMKRKEVKGNARKGRHAKEAKFTSRKLTGIQGKEIQEREGRVARWPAVSRQRVNPGAHRRARDFFEAFGSLRLAPPAADPL